MKTKPKKQNPKRGQLYTVNGLATLFDRDRATITRAIAACKIKPVSTVGHRLYSKDAVAAALGERGLSSSYAELRAEQCRQQARESKERADKLEMDNARVRGETVLMVEVQSLFSAALLPVRQRLLSLPAECATRVNPTDPVFAREQLQRWVDEALPQIRSQLPQPGKTK